MKWRLFGSFQEQTTLAVDEKCFTLTRTVIETTMAKIFLGSRNKAGGKSSRPKEKRIVKNTLLVCLLAVCNLTLVAQTTNTPRVVHIKEKSATHVPPQRTQEGLKKIYSNLGKSQTDLYDDADSWAVFGPNNSQSHVPSFIALPFTPKSNSHISQVQAAVQYAYGANQVNLSIYGDSGGVPGALLAGPVTITNLPEVGTCCLLAVANFSPIEVTGGIQYWVVADTPPSGTGSNFQGFWSAVVKPVIPMASNIAGSGWVDLNADGLPAGEVLGTIP